MEVQPPTTASLAASIGAPAGSELGRDAFLQLFVTQVRNQNPLEPQGNEAFLSQLAQFSSLELLEGVRASFDSLNAYQQVAQASSLLGKEVRYLDDTGTQQRGVVESVRLDGNQAILDLGNQQIPLFSVQEIYQSQQQET
jgi:flagellar basal-body rod modification protein FlgD